MYHLPEYLMAPLPSYLSLHTALHLRGLIEQIPEVFYAASLARTASNSQLRRSRAKPHHHQAQAGAVSKASGSMMRRANTRRAVSFEHPLGRILRQSIQATSQRALPEEGRR